MNSSKRQWVMMIFCGLSILCLILDGQTALNGAAEGVKICINTILPTLFPYIFLTTLLCSTIFGRHIPLIKYLGRLCGIPEGAESILLLGLIGGYPVGATLIANSYHHGQLSKEVSRRMMGFCSNAGPSFIFGMLSFLFSNRLIPWVIWFVHVISAVLVGILLPGKTNDKYLTNSKRQTSVSLALQQALKTVAMVCGWVILFKILITFINKWLLFCLPLSVQAAIAGVLELANGCISLQHVESEGLRLIICSCLLSIGGICVTMQTLTTSRELGLGMYIPGKVLQTLFSFILIIPACLIFFPTMPNIQFVLYSIPCVIIAAIGLLYYLRKHKKVVAIP